MSFRRKKINRYAKAKGFCVQNLVFLRVCTICKIESTIQKWLAGPKLIFAFESTRQTAAVNRLPARFWTQKRHQNTRLFKIVCFDAIESTRDFAPSDVRSASTASRSYFREQRVRDKLEPQLSLEHGVRDKSIYGLSGNRPAPPKQALFREPSPQDRVYLESIRTAF